MWTTQEQVWPGPSASVGALAHAWAGSLRLCRVTSSSRQSAVANEVRRNQSVANVLVRLNPQDSRMIRLVS